MGGLSQKTVAVGGRYGSAKSRRRSALLAGYVVGRYHHDEARNQRYEVLHNLILLLKRQP